MSASEAGQHGARQPLHAIVAVADNGVIGDGEGMLWHVPQDWARVKELTMGGHLVMGRATYESIGRPLPGRVSIVLTRDSAWGSSPAADGALPVSSLEEAFAASLELDPQATMWIFGGAEIYRAAWDLIEVFEVTEIHQSPEGAAQIPSVAEDPRFVEVARQDHDGYSFVTYHRA